MDDKDQINNSIFDPLAHPTVTFDFKRPDDLTDEELASDDSYVPLNDMRFFMGAPMPAWGVRSGAAPPRGHIRPGRGRANEEPHQHR